MRSWSFDCDRHEQLEAAVDEAAGGKAGATVGDVMTSDPLVVLEAAALLMTEHHIHRTALRTGIGLGF